MQFKILDSGLAHNYRFYGEVKEDWDFVDGLFDDLTDEDKEMYEETLEEIKRTNKYESEYYVDNVPGVVWVEVEFDNGERRKYELDLSGFWANAIPVFVYQLVAGSLTTFLEIVDEVDVAIWEADAKEILHGYDLQKGYNLAIPVERYDDPIRMSLINNCKDFKEYDGDFDKFQSDLENNGWTVA